MKHHSFKTAVLAPSFVWMTVLFLLPLAIVLMYSFLQRGTYGNIEYSFTLDNYKRIFDPLYLHPIIRSLTASTITTVVCLMIGHPLAYYISMQDERRRNFLLVLVMLPFWTDFLVRTYAWMVILRTEGVLNSILLAVGVIDQPIELLFTNTAVIIGLVYGFLPFMVLPLYASLEKLDPSLSAAANDLGASPLQQFWHVTFPLTKAGVIAGSILVFVPTFGAFITPDLLGGSKNLMIGNLIKDQFLSSRDWPFGAALSFVMMALVMILLLFYIRSSSVRQLTEGKA